MTMRKTSPELVLLLLAATALTLATCLQPRAKTWARQGDSENVFKALLGDTRRLFSNHFFVKADVSFHSGYYPSIFDQASAPKDSKHMMENHGDDHDGHEKEDTDHTAAEKAHEASMSFLGPPRDWIEKFGRRFMITHHSHLNSGREREILPWLKLSSELDPQRIETYTVSSYWLRSQLGKVDEAEGFLREGLRNNQDSYEILYELGRVLEEDRHDDIRARNLWLQSLKKWRTAEAAAKNPPTQTLNEITTHLARLEERSGNLSQAVAYWEMAAKTSPSPDDIEKHIEELNRSMANPNR